MTYSDEPVAVIVLGEREDWGDVLIIKEDRSNQRFTCRLRDDVLGGSGSSPEDAIESFAKGLEDLAKKARAKKNIRHCPACGRLKNDIKFQFCTGGACIQ